ncbi:hypothetical protein BD413DRAFT_225451 [Trametes elegans]|nr:hypothetical protein BD413DRAFT_225451 [Trametes elegans]
MLAVGLHRLAFALIAQPLLLPYCHRLRTLCLQWSCSDPAELNYKKGRKAVDEFLNQALPALAELRVSYCVHRNHAKEISIRDPARLPALRVLRLCGAYLSWQSPLFTSLRVLDLGMIAATMRRKLPLDTFLKVLERCQALEELRLVLALPVKFKQDEEDSTPGSDRVVRLPALRSLCLEWDHPWALDTSEVYQLLEHLSLPRAAAVEIAMEYDTCRETPHHLLDVVPRDATCLPILHNATALRVAAETGVRSTYTATAPGTENGRLELALFLDIPRHWSYNIGAQLEDVSMVLKGATITHLALDSSDFEASGLAAAFRNMRHLATIEATFVHLHALTELLNALGSTSSRIQVGEEEEAGPPVLPYLRELRLKTLPWHPRLLPDIEECLEWRAVRGTELTALRVEAYDRPTDEEDEVELDIQHTAQIIALQYQMGGDVEFVDVPRPAGRVPYYA